jgi:3-mercaptopyruvate sulfurtransferase SseA
MLFAAFQSGGVDVSQPIVFSCGGAMVAPLVAFALHLTGLSVPVYDVSYELLCCKIPTIH